MLLPATAAASSRVKRLAGWTFAATLCVYVLLGQGVVRSGDGGNMLEVTKAILLHGSVAVPDNIGAVGRGGRHYSQYGLGHSLAALPLVAAGYLAGKLLPMPGGLRADDLAEALASTLPAITTAATCALLLLLLAEQGFAPPLALAGALLYGFGTLAFPYAKWFYSEPTCILCLVAATLYLARGLREEEPAPAFALTGLLVGAAFLVRIAEILAVAIFGLAVLAAAISRRQGWGGRLRLVAAYALGAAVGIVTVAAYNWYRFGSPMETGHWNKTFTTPLLEGLYMQLLSPGRSLFLYTPAALLAFFGWRSSWRERRIIALVAAMMFAVHAAFYAKFVCAPGGWSYGPRYLLPVVPFLLLLAMPILRDARAGLPRALVVACCIVSAVVQLPAVYVHPSRMYFLESGAYPEEYHKRMVYHWREALFFSLWSAVPEVTRNALFKGERLRTMARRRLPGAGHAAALPGAGAGALRWRIGANIPNFWWVLAHYFGAPRAAIGVALALLVLAASWSICRAGRGLAERTADH